MPPTPSIPAGTELLQRLLTYTEIHFLPGGTCECGSNMDIAISVEAPVAPGSAQFDALKQVFIIECLKCKKKYSVTMEALANWDGKGTVPAEPEIPEADWPECSICHTKHKPKPAALKAICEPCSDVSKDIGQIVNVREQGTLLDRVREQENP